MRRTAALLMAIILLFTASIPACAITAYGQDEEETKKEFVRQYGWNPAKMEACSWLGDDGRQYTRQSSYEKSFYDDVYTMNEELAVTLGLITAVPVTGGNAASMVALAIAEWEAGVCETPMGSNNVKYNTWYYNRVVSGDSYPWCCAFISWLANQCGLIEAGVYTKTAGCAVMRSYFKNKGYAFWGIRQSAPYGGTETPIPGDIIIWGNNQHIGLIISVNDSSIETIEGNAGNRVSHCTYTQKDLVGNLGIAEIFRVEYPDTESTIYNFLVTVMGLSTAGAVGIIANIACESNFNEQALGDNGTSFGICQWHNARWDRLKSFCSGAGMDWQTVDGQLYYLQWELENCYPTVIAKIRAVANSADGAYSAAFTWCHDFEVPQGYEYSTSNYRGNNAKTIYWPKYAQMSRT